MANIIISTSLKPEGSKSLTLAKYAQEYAGSQGYDFKLVDLKDYDIPMCDASGSYDHPKVLELQGIFKEATGYLVATPIYNFTINSALKNLVELTGRTWSGKPVAFMCAAGGNSSYMAIMSIANSLMLDFRCPIVPKFVYGGPGSVFEDGNLEEDTQSRVDELIDTLQHWSSVL